MIRNDNNRDTGFFEPEKYFSRISHIDIGRDLISRGLDSVLLDIDNTIRSRETHDIPRDVGMWLGKARDAGIDFCLLSNNWHSDIHEFAESIDLPIVAKAMKPLPFAFASAMRNLDSNVQNTVVVGDQLLTDVVGAHLAGLPAYLVQPLVDADLKHTLLLRNVERVLLSGRVPESIPKGAGIEIMETSAGAQNVKDSGSA